MKAIEATTTPYLIFSLLSSKAITAPANNEIRAIREMFVVKLDVSAEPNILRRPPSMSPVPVRRAARTCFQLLLIVIDDYSASVSDTINDSYTGICSSRDGQCVHSYLQSFKDAPIYICVEPILGNPVAPRVLHAVDGQGHYVTSSVNQHQSSDGAVVSPA